MCGYTLNRDSTLLDYLVRSVPLRDHTAFPFKLHFHGAVRSRIFLHFHYKMDQLSLKRAHFVSHSWGPHWLSVQRKMEWTG